MQPMEAPQRFLDIYAKDEFCGTQAKQCGMQVEYAFSSVIDEGISNVTAALKARGMWERTLLVVVRQTATLSPPGNICSHAPLS
jgi:hypothetical protein